MSKALQVHWTDLKNNTSILFGGGLVLGTVTPTIRSDQFKVLRKSGRAHLEPIVIAATKEAGKKIVEDYHGIQEF